MPDKILIGRELLERILFSMQEFGYNTRAARDRADTAITDLRAALDAPQQEAVADVSCPVCGYYCLGKGGFGCIDKPAMLSAAPKPPSADDRKDAEICTHRFEQAPCYICGYNGPGYYQPAQHKCAEKYHAAVEKERKG